MRTKCWQIDPLRPDPSVLEQAAALIRAGEVVAFPTDTVYGLAADWRQEQALEKIFRAKERPQEQPLLLLVDSLEQMTELTMEIPQAARNLMDRFWPGALTLVLPGKEHLSWRVKNERGGVAIRMPLHPLTQALLALTGPITAPSANLHGAPSGISARMVLGGMDGRIAGVIDGGIANNKTSTLVDCCAGSLQLLREGAIPWSQLKMDR